MTTVVGTVAAAGLLAFVLAGHRAQFSTALGSAPLGILLGAAALQVVALVSRTESWHVCVSAAGGTASALTDRFRRRREPRPVHVSVAVRVPLPLPVAVGKGA